MAMTKITRIPTDAEWAVFDGLHCHAVFAECKRANWSCPGCKRSLRECVRWRWISGPSWRARYGNADGEGFTIGLHRHHDHGDRWKGAVVVCGVCNAADGAVKRMLCLPADWSFSVAEIAQFVTVEPHGGATIDYAKAERVYLAAAKSA